MTLTKKMLLDTVKVLSHYQTLADNVKHVKVDVEVLLLAFENSLLNEHTFTIDHDVGEDLDEREFRRGCVNCDHEGDEEECDEEECDEEDVEEEESEPRFKSGSVFSTPQPLQQGKGFKIEEDVEDDETDEKEGALTESAEGNSKFVSTLQLHKLDSVAVLHKKKPYELEFEQTLNSQKGKCMDKCVELLLDGGFSGRVVSLFLKGNSLFVTVLHNDAKEEMKFTVKHTPKDWHELLPDGVKFFVV